MTDKDKTTKKPFPLEKILTISLDEYKTMVDKTKSQLYDVQGVHYIGIATNIGNQPTSDENGDYAFHYKHFALTVPENAEVVVGLKVEAGFFKVFISGTALIPK